METKWRLICPVGQISVLLSIDVLDTVRSPPRLVIRIRGEK
jgi:hypothetical protein